MPSDNSGSHFRPGHRAPQKQEGRKAAFSRKVSFQTSSSITRVPLSAAAADSLQGRYVIVAVARADDTGCT
jgi:hypothetical protein